jgi:carbonic anhydrase
MAMTRRALASILFLLAAAAPPATAAEFGYFGDLGPDHWADLDPAWETCGTGERQSPVDLVRASRQRSLRVQYSATTGEIFNNGHTIEVETEGDNVLTHNGIEFELVQFHFHVGSEHRVQGRGYDMELHLVHRDAEGRLAVVGVFLKRGSSSGALAPIFASLPDDVDVRHHLESEFDPTDFLPARRDNYRYSGSLTTPPCSENVRWFVMLDPVTVSDEDIAQFAERIHFNARKVMRTR